MDKQKAIGYWRVSIEDKKRNQISPATQREKIEAFCKSQDWKLIKMFGDMGVSGATLRRKGLQELLEYIKSHKVDVVICYKLDRLSRKQRDSLNLIEGTFRELGVGFKSVSEPFDTTTPMGRAGMGMVMVFSQLERDQISQRTKDALATLKENGRRLGGPNFVPFGFSLRKRKMATLKDLKPNGDFPTLKKIRHSKKSITKLANELEMAKSSIHYIRNNPVYEKLSNLWMDF